MALRIANIKHDGGTHRVEVETEDDQVIIRFGASFTLRVDESNLNTLRDMIHEAVRDLCIERRDTSGVYTDSLEEDFIQAGIDAREALKAERMMKGTADPTLSDWNPDDPSNW